MIEILLIATFITLLISLYLQFQNKSSNSDMKFQTSLDEKIKLIHDEIGRNREENSKNSLDNRQELSKNLNQFSEKFERNLKDIKDTINNQLKDIRDDNTKQLDKMRDTVDQKLQETLEKKIGESFNQVRKQLDAVHKGLGEMQNVAAGVGDLKKVLSNVKTKGVFGEYQLGNILEQILTPDQYGHNVATNPDYNGSVEYAVKMPGNDNDMTLWLPIDSKFPTESYESLLDAYEIADKNAVEAARKQLIRAVDGFAKDISTKYISVPNTTDFAIMFVPIEGLFAEILREPGIMETLRSKHKISLTGPTTLSALLNSLQMGFRTLRVQESSSKVWNILSAVKSEFSTFGNYLSKVQTQLKTASSSLDTLQGTRTRAMERKLRDVELIDGNADKDLLDIPSEEEIT
ncbi:MAG: DNA recombination protein RmuC [Candidatus Marinimicrobia bacterium]|nr:DNA recombination protein RmuC [Candidatus Neomarinimicrobiota bacterium]|tara:strand:+ start:466 stop:1677 length:1212 start_codon:yes stop_codon:yes gene_type:complete